MTRLFCCLLSVVFAALVGPVIVSAQVVGGPSGNTNPPNRPRQQTPNRQPAPPSQDWLRLLFPDDQYSDNGYDEPRRSQDARVIQRPVPSAKLVAKMTPSQQRGLLRQAVVSLEQDLSKLPEEGAAWKNYLRIESLGSSLWGQSSPSPDSMTRDILKEIANTFDAVEGNADYSIISNLWGFKAADIALPLYSQSAVERNREQLGAVISRFDERLGRVRHGDHWKKHLQTEDVKRLASQSEELSKPDKDILKEIHRRIKVVKQDEKYRVVATLNGYSETDNSLRDLIEAIDAQRKEEMASRVLKSIALGKDATRLERTVVAALKEMAKLKTACSAEGNAKVQAAMSKTTLSLGPADRKKVLARQASEADEVLRLIKDRHRRATKATDENLYNILRLIKAAKTQEREGETVLVLPLNDTEPEATETWVMPLDESEAKGKNSATSRTLQSITLSKNATSLERTVVVTLKELAKLKAGCAAESKAKMHAAMSSKLLSLSDADQKKELARKADEADKVLRLAKDEHDQTMKAAQEHLLKILRMLKSGRKEEQEGETVMLLPLPVEEPREEGKVRLLPLPVEEPN